MRRISLDSARGGGTCPTPEIRSEIGQKIVVPGTRETELVQGSFTSGIGQIAVHIMSSVLPRMVRTCRFQKTSDRVVRAIIRFLIFHSLYGGNTPASAPSRGRPINIRE